MEKAHMYIIFVVLLVLVRGAFTLCSVHMLHLMREQSRGSWVEVWIRSWMELLWHQRQAPPLQQLLLCLPPSLLLCSQSAWMFFTFLLLSFFCSPSLVFLYSLWLGWAPELVWINAPALSCSFWFSRFVFLFFVFLFFLTRQPSCSPGKISLTAQCKSPSSMITRAYYKTLDKCQRGLRGGDLEDIWRRDRPALTVAHTQHQVQNKQA